MRLELLQRLNEARAAREAAIVLTDLASGGQDLLLERQVEAHIEREALETLLRNGRSGSVELGGTALFAGVYLPPVKLVCIGAVHISQALAPMARLVGLDVTIVDPREAFATTERFQGVDLRAEWPDVALPEIGLDRWSAFCALTHDPKIDDPGLHAALRAGCFYIGALGSRKTHGRRVERLTEAGFAADEIARIHAPIGLPIGAQSPSEIALSILSEITAVRRLKPQPR
ncbi:XdhC family protein [Lutibaculum baratangense]|uniref:Carbon monoxide dehydrogenase F protein n=1 Tax=Lutibaculum baratangense AMV1 TaxID=631454 RepID=V4RGS9_9HYPH|nr:XdhC family protein [Lutibaculum baratangense]ESR22475.1 Carbon monoxide dehydrogenase F protein [Lutibaculum baratangense AMV1]